MAEVNVDSLMQNGLKEFQSSMQSRAEGDLEDTRLHLLKASEKLFMASSLSQGSLRESRKQLAQQLLDEANSLTITSLPIKTTPANKNAINLGDDTQADSWIVKEKPNVRFEDIAGLEEVKEQIRLKLLYPFTHTEVAKQYGIHPGGGMLLYGPPGRERR